MAYSVFIFDDDPDILLMCGIVLKQMGYNVHTSTDCNNVVSKVLDAGVSVVLMDNKIAPEGGIVATRQLKSTLATSHIPVIYFSANTNVEQLSRDAGANYFIQKPFDINDLEKLIAQSLEPQQAS